MKPRQIVSLSILGPALTFAIAQTALYNCTNKNSTETQTVDSNNNIDNAIKIEGENAKANFILLQKSDNNVKSTKTTEEIEKFHELNL